MNLITVTEAHKLAVETIGKISKLSVYLWAKQGKFVSIKIGASPMIDKASFEKFLSAKLEIRKQQARKRAV